VNGIIKRLKHLKEKRFDANTRSPANGAESQNPSFWDLGADFLFIYLFYF